MLRREKDGQGAAPEVQVHPSLREAVPHSPKNLHHRVQEQGHDPRKAGNSTEGAQQVGLRDQ